MRMSVLLICDRGFIYHHMRTTVFTINARPEVLCLPLQGHRIPGGVALQQMFVEAPASQNTALSARFAYDRIRVSINWARVGESPGKSIIYEPHSNQMSNACPLVVHHTKNG